MRAYPPPPSSVFLALLGADIAGGIICPPSWARNSQTLSSARVKDGELMRLSLFVSGSEG